MAEAAGGLGAGVAGVGVGLFAIGAGVGLGGWAVAGTAFAVGPEVVSALHARLPPTKRIRMLRVLMFNSV